jgi:hypothetical protein
VVRLRAKLGWYRGEQARAASQAAGAE